MHVLVLGGYGFIGLEAARRLAREHRITAVGRSGAFGKGVLPQATWIEADIASLDTPEKWAPLLSKVDVVVNASGALQDGARDDLRAVQDVAIRALIRACETAAVRRVVQISAPGASAEAKTEFLRTKASADAALKRSNLEWIILRPGLVWGRTASGGTALVRMLSAFPWVQPLVLANSLVQTVDIDEVSDAIAAAAEGKLPAGSDLDLVESAPRTLSEIVAAVRTWHGFSPPLTTVVLPSVTGELIARAADISGWLGWRSPLRTTSLRSLEQGVVGDASQWVSALGVEPSRFEQSLQRRPATRQDRVFACTQLMLPFIVACLAIFWVASGIIGLLQLKSAAQTIHTAVAYPEFLVAGGSLVDIGLGIGLLWRPWARAACAGMVALTVTYLALGTWLTPLLWFDPLGPFLKTLPAAMLAIVCASLLEER